MDMPAVEYACWYICSLLSLSVAAVFFCISQFVELQFANSKLAFSIFIVILLIGFSSFVNKAEFFRTKMDHISMSRFRWILKAIVEFSILIFVTMLIVLMKYPRFSVSDKQEEHTTKQGDQMGFFSAATFSLYIFSTSMLLKLREEYGLFYMCLELTMNAAVEMPGIGGSILNWYYVGPTSFYCFLLIIVRCYFHSSHEVRRRGGNGDDHDDVNDAVGPTGVRVELQPTTGVTGTLSFSENEQQGGHDTTESGGGGGGRETGEQGHTIDLGSTGSGWETVSAEEAEGKLIDYIRSVPYYLSKVMKVKLLGFILRIFLYTCLLVLNSELTKVLTTYLLSTSEDRKLQIFNGVIGVCIAGITVTGALLLRLEYWFTCKRIGYCCFGWCMTVFEFGLRFAIRVLRKLGLELNQEGDSHDGAEGGGGGTKTGDQGVGSDWEIVSAKEDDEHKAERAEDTSSSDDEIERISNTSNVLRERRKQSVSLDQEKADAISDRKSVATESIVYGESFKYLSTGKED